MEYLYQVIAFLKCDLDSPFLRVPIFFRRNVLEHFPLKMLIVAEKQSFHGFCADQTEPNSVTEGLYNLITSCSCSFDSIMAAESLFERVRAAMERNDTPFLVDTHGKYFRKIQNSPEDFGGEYLQFVERQQLCMSVISPLKCIFLFK